MNIVTSANQELTLQDADILLTLSEKVCGNQRELAAAVGLSLGTVNRCLQRLTRSDYVDQNLRPTVHAEMLLAERKPKNAIILAAGPGMRMVPINFSLPKALLEVKGERLVERLIRQLNDVGITDITVVVGFMNESFEYLIDKFGVELVVNCSYLHRNNSFSLHLAADRLNNTYIVPADLYCAQNPFRRSELYSWYLVSDKEGDIPSVRVNRKRELVYASHGHQGNRMIGISYLLAADGAVLRENLIRLVADRRYDNAYWEDALFQRDRMMLPARIVRDDMVTEINTYEQLRDIDASSRHLQTDAVRAISKALMCRESEVEEIRILKKGMTNRSFLFSVRGRRYIMRIPGEGTDRLIDRRQEAEVFRAISGHGLCDDPVYFDPKSGYKITAYLDGVRACNPNDNVDTARCMSLLRRFHAMRLQVSHSFDLFGMIDYYESLRGDVPSSFQDYPATKENVLSLRSVIDAAPKELCLTHIDAVPDNFLFCTGPDGQEALQLIDWEYAGMQDPHVDVAMFCVYSLYSKSRCDELIDLYFEGRCSRKVRCKLYCYIAVCGLLWSNWCEFKRSLGVEFGEYSLRQYRYAKDFYRFAQELLSQEEAEVERE